jgi:signal transduction histidine kinase
VEAHGGDIRVKSKKNVGGKFILTIPGVGYKLSNSN